jgi:BCD family chlorophyll transporter-like MFS transporter
MWVLIARCGLAQMAIGAVAALMTSTLNRVMIVELALPATVPALLVAIHFMVQTSRSRFGFESDRLRRRTPLVLGGAVVQSLGGVLAAVGVAMAHASRGAGLALCVLAFMLIGVGMSAAGTSLLALVAERVEPKHRGGAAALLWVMMIFGIVVTAATSGAALEPFSMRRLVVVTSVVCGGAVVLSVVGMSGVEARWPLHPGRASGGVAPTTFRAAWRAVSSEGDTMRFAAFVFLSMLAYSMQDLILEPFAGRVYGMTPGESTQLAASQHAGVMIGMLLAAPLSARWGTLRGWAAWGCLLSATSLLALAFLPVDVAHGTLRTAVFTLGAANGVFAVGALGAMMGMTSGTQGDGVGLRLGVYGAAQAIAYGIGGSVGGIASDLAIAAWGDARLGYAGVFAVESALFVTAAWIAARLHAENGAPVKPSHRAEELWRYQQSP